jgi:hypothetical protein
MVRLTWYCRRSRVSVAEIKQPLVSKSELAVQGCPATRENCEALLRWDLCAFIVFLKCIICGHPIRALHCSNFGKVCLGEMTKSRYSLIQEKTGRRSPISARNSLMLRLVISCIRSSRLALTIIFRWRILLITGGEIASARANSASFLTLRRSMTAASSGSGS